MDSNGNLTRQPGPVEVPITGAEGYTIRQDGIVKLHGRRVDPEEIGLWRANKHKPGHKFRTRAHLAIYLGDHYSGHVPAIGKVTDTNWWTEPPNESDAAPRRERELRMLDEVVAHEFVAVDPYAYVESVDRGLSLTLIHLDGNEQNCHAKNLRWVLGGESTGMPTMSLMRHDLPRRASRASRQARAPREPRWTGAHNLPGHTPITSERAG